MPEIHGTGPEDDSPFLSMADFFSLISLTLIYAMLVLAPSAPVPKDAVTILTGRMPSEGQQIAVDPGFAYVSIEADGDGYHVEYRWPTNSLYSDVRISGAIEDVRVARVWLTSALLVGPRPDRVVFYMRDDEIRPEAHRLFNLLQQSTKRGYPVSAAYLHNDAP
jgi:hypothetical protein